MIFARIKQHNIFHLPISHSLTSQQPLSGFDLYPGGHTQRYDPGVFTHWKRQNGWLAPRFVNEPESSNLKVTFYYITWKHDGGDRIVVKELGLGVKLPKANLAPSKIIYETSPL